MAKIGNETIATGEREDQIIYPESELRALDVVIKEKYTNVHGVADQKQWLIDEKALTEEGSVIVPVTELTKGGHIKRCAVSKYAVLMNKWGQLMMYRDRQKFISQRQMEAYAGMPEGQGSGV